MEATPATTRLIEALERIEEAAAANVARSLEVGTRAAWFRDQLQKGASIGPLVAAEAQPRVVELLTTNMSTLETVGAQFRATLALALRSDGLTIQAIADMFGVSRQRISALLKQRAAEPS